MKQLTFMDMLSRQFFVNTHLLVLTIVVILVAGVSSYVNLPRLEDPRIVQRNPLLLTSYPGASADRVETLVTEPLEEALQEIPEIKNFHSTSSSGMSVISIELQDQVTSDTNQEIFAEIRDEISEKEKELPAGAQAPVMDDKRQPVAYTLIVALRWAKDTEARLDIQNRLAEELADRLRGVKGTELVRLFGEPAEEIRIQLEAERLAMSGLRADEIAGLLSAADSKEPAGVLRTGEQSLSMEVAGEFETLERIRNVPLVQENGTALLTVQDVAQVSRGWRTPPQEIGLVKQARSIFVAARMGKGEQVDRWSKDAKAVVAQMSQQVSGGIEMEIIFDQSQYTTERLNTLFSNLLAGAGVVMAVIFFQMGWRFALILGTALPLVVSLVLFAILMTGNSLHQMSIFGMIIALGLLIDNAIVVTDEISKKLNAGRGRLEAIQETVSHLFTPLLASMLTTVFAFAPILLLPGNAGDFVGSIGQSVVFAILFSFLIAMTVIASLAGRFGASTGSQRHHWFRDGIYSPALFSLYQKTLRGLLRRPGAAVMLACFLPASGFLLAQSLGDSFFPPVDRDMFELKLWMPTGTSIEETARRIRAVEDLILAQPEAEAVYWMAGGSFPSVFYNLVMNQDNSPHYAHGIIKTESSAATERMLAPLQRLLDDRFADSQLVLREFGQGPPVFADIEFRLFGPSVAELQNLGERLRLHLQSHPDVLHTQTSIPRGEPKLVVHANEEELKYSGLTLQDVSRQLGARMEGVTGGSVLENQQQMPLRVQLPDAERGDLEEVQSFPLRAGVGNRWIPLGAVSQLRFQPELGGLSRYNGERCNIIEGYTRSGALAIRVTQAVLDEARASGFDLPPGYRIEIGGESEQDAEATNNLALYAPMLLTMTVAILILSFRSVTIALLLVSVASLSVGLGLLSTWMISFPLSFNTILGTLGLIGVALNDSIVVIAAIRADARARMGELEAIVEQVLGCTRHILSTTFTTIGGFLPLLLFVGGDFWPSLAIVLVGGIAGASFLALVYVPSVYRLLSKMGLRQRQTG